MMTQNQEAELNPWGNNNENLSNTQDPQSQELNTISSWEENNILGDSKPPTSPLIDPKTEQFFDTKVPFVSEVEEFNEKFNKPNNYTPVIPEKKEWQFVYDFILEELEEYKTACEEGDIVGVLDALCDITYVSLGNGTMLHGLKTKIWPAYKEVQLSNISKACKTPQEALDTVKECTEKYGEECHVEQVNDMYIVYRTRDRKVMKNINYFAPNLLQFFSEEEIKNAPTPLASEERSAKTELPTSEGLGLQSSPEVAKIDLKDLENYDTFEPTSTEELDTEDYW